MRRLTRLAVGLAVLPAIAICAPAAFADSGGLSVSPAILDTPASTWAGGTIGTETIKNTTTGPLAITISVRPWKQSSTGTVAPSPNLTLASNIKLSATSFSLAAGASQTITLTLAKTPTGGSLFGNFDVVGVPMGTPKKNGIIVAYRLISTIRLEPAAPVHTLEVAAPTVSGTAKTRALSALIRNAGNTVDPINGTATITGAGGTKAFKITGIRILPGGIVNVKLGSLVGRKIGKYSVAILLSQGTTTTPVVKLTKKFTVTAPPKPKPKPKPKKKPKKG